MTTKKKLTKSNFEWQKELEIIAEYDDKLEILKKYFPLKNSGSKEVING
jgi:hypothetical protein